MKRKSTKTIAEWCVSCQNKSVCEKLARSCKKMKISQKSTYALFARRPSINLCARALVFYLFANQTTVANETLWWLIKLHRVVLSRVVYQFVFLTIQLFLNFKLCTMNLPEFYFLARILARFAVGSRQDFSHRDYCFPVRILVSFTTGSRQDFGRGDYCFPAKTLVSFAAGSHQDFGRRDFCFSARILARFAAGSRRDSGRRDFCFPARILARFEARSRRDFGHWEFRFPARILPGLQQDSRREEKSRRPKSRRDPGGISAEITVVLI